VPRLGEPGVPRSHRGDPVARPLRRRLPRSLRLAPVNRLAFAWRVARRSPLLLVDYVRLSRSAPTVPESTSFPAISVEEALALIGSPPASGPAHSLVLESIAALRGEWSSMDADTSLGELAYAIARMLRPDVVIETGVARGITSAFVLAALEDNSHGRLES